MFLALPAIKQNKHINVIFLKKERRLSNSQNAMYKTVYKKSVLYYSTCLILQLVLILR